MCTECRQNVHLRDEHILYLLVLQHCTELTEKSEAGSSMPGSLRQGSSNPLINRFSIAASNVQNSLFVRQHCPFCHFKLVLTSKEASLSTDLTQLRFELQRSAAARQPLAPETASFISIPQPVPKAPLQMNATSTPLTRNFEGRLSCRKAQILRQPCNFTSTCRRYMQHA